MDLRQLLQVNAIYVINLKKRADRLAQCKAQFEQMGVDESQWQRFEAIEPTEIVLHEHAVAFEHYCHTPKQPSMEMAYLKNSFACLLSHLAVVRLAKEANFKRILILEDDFCFKKSIATPALLSTIGKQQCDLLYLAYQKTKKSQYKQRGDNFVQCLTEFHSTAAYIMDASVFDFLLDSALAYGMQIDSFHAHQIQPNYVALAHNQSIVEQRPGHSDIYQYFVDYRQFNKI